ncbi:SEC-C domain-containing protein [Candidatus Dojkabacteria bacterium]|nr:SEC-C domain-containing protein [Candidatus Dojkabacteria bacterium]
MIKRLFKNIFDSNDKALKSAEPTLKVFKEKTSELENKDLEQLREIVGKYQKDLIELNRTIPEESKQSLKVLPKKEKLTKEELAIQDYLLKISPEFFAIINQIYKRKIGITFHDVQILAGTILSQGHKLTELKTGEGKTMVFQLPAFLYALAKRGSHVVTVNDYLARVGGEYAGQIAKHIGLSVGIITPQASYRFIDDAEVKKLKGEDEYNEMKNYYKENEGITISNMRGFNLLECDKRDAYNCDVVYGTNNEFGFDYLRDNMARSLEDIKQKELYFVIIDEADSILIDEARTPLIISSPSTTSDDLYEKFARAVKRLKKEEDYEVDEKAHSATLTENGIAKMEKILGVKNIWEDYQFAHHLDNSLKAMALYKKDIDYLLKDGQVLIVDQFTGRVLAGRRYSEGLHQAIEAKEGVEIKKESKTLATITFQNFFRLYKFICGGSGTIMTEAEEFFKIYELDSVEVPTDKPVIRKDQNDRVYKNRTAKFQAVAEEIKRVHAKGQPVLVGTTSIEDSEYLSELVEKIGIEHEVLNAKHHEREAHIVSRAGFKGAVTIATNMAGRGTDIPLKDRVQDLGGLYVIGTQRHESRRIDNQLRGRSGRQGDPGESRFFISLDDDIMRIQGGQIVQRLMEMTKIPDNMPIEAGLIGRSIESAQKKMENMHFDSRKRVVEYDNVINQQREIFYAKRRSYLNKTENAKGIFLSNNQITQKEESDPAVLNAQEDAKKMINKSYLGELDNIFNIHFLDDRQDKIDIEKLSKDFLDFAPDSSIASAIIDLRLKNKLDDKEVQSFLVENLQGKDMSSSKEFLWNILKKLLVSKEKELGLEYFEVLKQLYLETMDHTWTDHLETMQDLREGIGLRGYAQRDPLIEYKNEAYKQFELFVYQTDSQVTRRLLKVNKVVKSQASISLDNSKQISDISEGSREMINSIRNVLKNNAAISQSSSSPAKKINIGRNDPCYCGSGKKYKKCHGKNI